MEINCLMGQSFHLERWKTVLEMNGGDGCTTLWMYIRLETEHLKMVTVVNLFVVYPLKQILKIFLLKKRYNRESETQKLPTDFLI